MRQPRSLEEDAALYAAPTWAIELRNSLTGSLAGLAAWQEVTCSDCGSAQRQGRCKRPSGHDRDRPHPERADAYDRLVWTRAAARIAAFAATLRQRGFVPSRPNHLVCTACGAPPLCPCVGPFDPAEGQAHLHKARTDAFEKLTPAAPAR